MSEFKGTPGPWSALEKSGPNVARVVSKEGNNIAFLSAMNGRSKDDCHLIAAAPALLEALIATRAALVRLAWEENSLMIEGIDTAIAKSLGEDK